MNSVLEVKNLEKFYKNKGSLTRAVDHISFEVGEDVYKRQRQRSARTPLEIAPSFFMTLCQGSPSGHFAIAQPTILAERGRSRNLAICP